MDTQESGLHPSESTRRFPEGEVVELEVEVVEVKEVGVVEVLVGGGGGGGGGSGGGGVLQDVPPHLQRGVSLGEAVGPPP